MSTRDADDVKFTHNRAGWVWVAVCAALGLMAVVDSAVRGSLGATVVAFLWVASLVWGVYLVFVVPKAVATSRGIVVDNLINRVFVPWARLADARTRYFLEILTDEPATVTVWAAPNGSRNLRRRVLPGSPGRLSAAAAETDMYDDAGAPGAPRDPLAASVLVERDRALEKARKAGTAASGSGSSWSGEDRVVRTRLLTPWIVLVALDTAAIIATIVVLGG